ncbi:Rne/Rng family ribonuclease [Arthrobacter sulfonylureivorans]|uniref:Rne/Rng family ribonuclease n=1 Tax=Arthrobacter sulfonylureivorans TaxID=2486855 RepID=A0ABY3WGR7_9MICC|nr:Rne/Rng family ribonuclease [Arthrobacter sulfonylureivorans]UNK47492.1 Rne/Rng family ribonuclease [Arthrobacter sulfonylureivorans]
MDNEQVIPATSAPAESPEGTAKKPPRPRRKPTVSAPSQDQLDVQLPAAAVDSTNDGGASSAAPGTDAAPAAEQPAGVAPEGSQSAGPAQAATTRTRRPRKTAAEKAAEAAAAQASQQDEAAAAASGTVAASVGGPDAAPAAEAAPAAKTRTRQPRKTAAQKAAEAAAQEAALQEGTDAQPAAEPTEATGGAAPDGVLDPAVQADDDAAGKPARKRRSRAAQPVEQPVDADGILEAEGAEEPAEKPAGRRRTAATTRTRRSTSAQTTEAAAELTTAEGEAPADAQEPAAAEADPSGAQAATAQTAAAMQAAGAGVATEPASEAAGTEPAGEQPAKAPSRRRRSTGATAPAATETAEATAAEQPAPAAGSAAEEEQAEEAAEAGAGNDPFTIPSSPVSLLFHAPDLSAVAAKPETAAAADSEEEDEDGGQRRSRRNRRGRTRNRAEESGSGEAGGAEGTDEAAESAEEGAAGEKDGVTSRRRRRRRRGDADLELTGGSEDDPPNTVTRVRAPRPVAETAPSNKVASVKGSTRLEAKKQRRRESRESGRRRQVITEAEFLARRESVDRQMVVRQRDDRIQIGVLEDGVLAEHFVSKTQQDSLIGNVYLGKVQNVLPSMEAAFIDIGRGRNAVLYAGEVNWDAAHLDGQPRRIELALKSGDSVLVQVTKDPVGHKGARLTSQISLPGRFLVYVPGGSMTGISRKLPDVERNRLKKILKEHVPDGAGVIVRTAAEGASEEELMNDINRLRAQWEGIESRAGSTKTLAPEMLYAEPDLTIKVVRDVFNEDFSKLVVSGEEAWDTIEAYVTYVAPDLVDRLEKWTSETDIFAAQRLDEQIHKALDRKVFLPSGGSLVIDRTEAMTVVDVNTGKFTGSGGNLEETVTKNNLEAAEEVVRQLRLRDIGGIIVIDFIDMVLESNRDLVLRRLVECLGRDRTKHQVAEVTSLGLVQMTRKRMGTGLLEVFGEQCEHCAGRGVITHDEPVEHRRVGAATEHHQVRIEKRSERQSRSEKRRSRGQGQQESPSETPAPVVQEDDAERKAKAEAARAALANIAAAAHAAHEAEEHPEAAKAKQHDAEAAPAASGAGKPDVAAATAPAQGQPAATGRKRRSRRADDSGIAAVAAPAATADEDGGAGVLKINGETVAIPRATHAPVAAPAEPSLTLESLTEAFNKVAPVEKPERTAPVAAPEPAAAVQSQAAEPSVAADQVRPVAAEPQAPAAAPVRKPRRRRAASSPQGAADAPVETVDAAVSPEGNGSHRHAAAAPAAPALAEAAAGKAEAAAPLVLGVGVPASEL